jgi:LytS/YehU family sensor histidine kinase
MPHRKKTRVALHILVVSIMILLPIVDAPSPDASKILLWSNPYLPVDFLLHLFCLGFAYINYFFLVPKFFYKPYKVQYFILVILMFLFLAVTPVFIISNLLLVKYFGLSENILIHELNQLRHVVFLFAFAFIYSTMSWMEHKRRNIEHEISDAELRFLKAQINPHFLFNSLNTIYAQLQFDSQKAGESLVKMSEIMRYVLNAVNNNKEYLNTSIHYLENYIYLQKIRFEHTLNIQFVNRIENPKEYQIASLLLIPFVENAFKYGVSPHGDSTILIELSNQNEQLFLRVLNEDFGHLKDESMSHGIGIFNTRKRLDMLYPGRYTLSAESRDNHFEVLFQIHLDYIPKQ